MLRRVGRSISHVCGERRFDLQRCDVVVFCLVKDAGFFLREFIDHHLALGINRIVLIDNGSTDDTLTIARAYTDVTVIQSQLPVKEFECHMRQYAARRFAAGHWCLFVDSDEQFDFPFSSRLALRDLVRYLTDNGFSAVVTQMLDMFPAGAAPLNQGSSVSEHDSFTLEALSRRDYHSEDSPFHWFLKHNKTSNPNIRFLSGGVRKLWFDLDCCLTKHSLVHLKGKVIPVAHPHCATNVTCADFTAMVRHYKFAGDFQSRIRRQVEGNVWEHGEDEVYLASEGKLLLPNGTQRFTGVDVLVQHGFLVVSEQFQEFVSHRCKERP